MSDECFFCAFVRKEIQTDIVYEDEHVLAFRDVNPQAPTHILVIPKRHVVDVAHLAAGDGPLLEAMVAAANRVAAREGVDSSGYRLVANVGPDAGQSVFHLHLHVLGGRSMAWPPG